MPLKNLFTKKLFGFESSIFCFFLVVFTIPWSNNLNSQTIVLFCVSTALTTSITETKSRLKSDLLWIYFSAFFLLIASSLIWDDRPFSSLKPLEKYAGFLFLPPFITAMPRLNARALKTCLLLFVTSTVIITLVCFIKSAKEYTKSGDYRVFHYQYLSQQMDLNAIYLSLYCCFSIVILLYFSFIHAKTGKRAKGFALLICLSLTGAIILLSAKMVIAILALVIITIILYIGFKRGRLLQSVILVLIILAAGIITISQVHYIKWRIGVTEVKKYQGAGDNQNGLAVRQIIWESAIESISEKPVLGYGIESASVTLIEKYKQKNFELGIIEEYNAHNTYLQLGLHCGIIGILLLILLLGATIAKALSQKNFFLCFTLLIILPQSITESMFEVQKGIIFFVVFICLFANHSAGKAYVPRAVVPGPDLPGS